MERERALQELTISNAVAIRLRDLGATDAEIASALGIPEESVGPLLRIADSKLARLLEQAEGQ